MLCPYCRKPLANKLEYVALSNRHRSMVDAIMASGPVGIPKERFVELFFKGSISPITVRTTLNRLNGKIKPLRIATRNGIVRLR